MSNESSVTQWIKENTDLSWARAGGDKPPLKQDRLYINRSEGYEIRDFILKYYDEFNLRHNPNNYEITLKNIMKFKNGEKVKTQDLLTHLSYGLRA